MRARRSGHHRSQDGANGDDAGIGPLDDQVAHAAVDHHPCRLHDRSRRVDGDDVGLHDAVHDDGIEVDPVVHGVDQVPLRHDPPGLVAVADHDETGEFVILRCPVMVEGCRELARIPLTEGITGYGYHDEDVLPGSIHNYRVYLDRGLGMEMLFETGGLEVPVAPAELFQNNPNPFNPGTRIRWYLPSPSRVRITIFDVSGRPVRLLVDDNFGAGINSADWDGAREGGSAAASGVYFYRIEAGSFIDSKKMILIR